MPEKWDFSKIEEQKKFDELSQEEKDEIVGKSQIEAGEKRKAIESGEAKDYAEAEKIAEWEKEIQNYDVDNFHIKKLLTIPIRFHQEILFKLIGRQTQYAMRNISQFKSVDYNKIAHKLIETEKNSEYLIKYLEDFKNLDEEIALKIIEKKYDINSVLTDLKVFKITDYNKIAREIFDMAESDSYRRNNIIDCFGKNLYKFKNLDKEIAFKFIENSGAYFVAKNLGSFNNASLNEIGVTLIENGCSKYFDINLLDLNNEIAHKLVDEGKSDDVITKNLNKFHGLDKELAMWFFERGEGASVAYNLDSFQNLDKEIAIKIIESKKEEYVYSYLDKFSGLDNEVALKIIEVGGESGVINNLEKFVNLNHYEIAAKIIEAGILEFLLDNLDKFHDLDMDKIREISKKHFITVDEAILIVGDNINSKKEEKEEESVGVYEILKNFHQNWRDLENIIKPFEAGADEFGYQKMFEYLGRPELSRHDGLHNFLEIIKAYEASGLKAPAFFNNILEQVRRDDAEYYEGTAHHHLNSLVGSIDYDFDGVSEKAKEYSGIEKLQSLMAELGDTKKIFASWKNLKKYREVCELLGRKEILDNLQSLKKEGKSELYKYIETLAFHPNISMDKVFEFWKNPEDFLQIADTHTPEEVHNRKKPSNYIEMPNLDLTAEELRDALVEGAYDHLQAFTPMEIMYEMAKGERAPLREDLARQIGVRDKDLRKKLGISESEDLKSNPKLFAKLNQIFKAQGFDLKKYLNGEVELPEKLAQELDQFRTKLEGEEYRVKINRKSDPDGVVAGNDTACCMPFGSGKNNVYTFNPICALFTVQKKNTDGTFRTIAQSVLTLDKDIKENIAELLEKLNSTETKMHEIVNEDVLINKPSVITCDNVELAENYKGHPNAGQILEEIYRDFFREYIQKFSGEQNLDRERLIVGQGYSDSLRHLPEVNNTFIPEAPVGYSDNLHEKAYKLDLKSEIPDKFIKKKEITFAAEGKEKTELHTNWPKGVSSLTYRDSLPVAYIEGKAYRDNESLIQYLHNMENALIAKDVNNEAKGRANMSFKYQDADGKIHGYLLAYEGKINDKEEYNGEKVLYITDLASDGNKRAGGSLILAFSEEYKKNYLEKDNPIPIYMQLRENTSYPIIKKQFDKLLKDTGYKFNFEELGNYESGEDIMHEVIIRAEKID